MSSSIDVKNQEDVKIKPDPSNAGTPPVHEEDDYEDTGELNIRGTAQDDQAWLAKLPKWLWEAWSAINDDEEIVLGHVRVYNDLRPDGKQKLKIVLDDIPQHASVPKRYDVTMSKERYNNTVAFSEKDQPGFRGGQQSWRRDRNSNRYGGKFGGGGVAKRPYRSSIPKQTALAGYLQHEVVVTAVENDEYRRLTAARFAALSKPKNTTTFTTGVDHAMHPGLAAGQHFSTFVSAHHAGGGAGGAHKVGPGGVSSSAAKRRAAQADKAVRVSEEELLDLLHDCFKQYRYWSLRALKQRLHQPEAFIKGTLEKIATLIRSGSFNGQWKLRPEYEATLVGMEGVKEEGAGEVEGDDGYGDDVDDDDDDEGDDFEDVKMEDG